MLVRIKYVADILLTKSFKKVILIAVGCYVFKIVTRFIYTTQKYIVHYLYKRKFIDRCRKTAARNCRLSLLVVKRFLCSLCD